MLDVCSIPVLATFFAACTGLPPLATGYVEGEYRLIAPITTAQVETLNVARGARVTAGEVLAVMETRDAAIALAEAKAALEAAESELDNLREGRRQEEIAVIEASLASAKAEAAEAEREAKRQEDLARRGIAPSAQAEDARTRADVTLAKIAEVEANLAVAKLPARPQEIQAAHAALAQAEAGVSAAQWQLERRTLAAPADGQVHEVLRTAGEIAGPQAPVLSMLPDGAVLLRLYVPQSEISRLSIGSELTVNCDGCPEGQTAHVTYLADGPEFTPPVIYSLDNRQKLVYLVEARPDVASHWLKPGQIVDVRLSEPES
ncbi:HlyD family secretion protein [Tropicimonas isoalkanivorans]|uniref:HlyD family secretion protein n=1 Tax=Tropicimonas isoalkanivorans TaxID=441112 RepID=A0A1I1DNR7_9RHOB|nr:HlyD family efflux transporter periplasmic adaptor subunit [Tropicimonas isoalkanivorans]SFB76659.1 HlyD family secretion protein [Tropicimonas isoalkanivorans]